MASTIQLSNVPVLFAVINESTAATNEIVAAVTGKKIRVMSYAIVCGGGANTVTWVSGSTNISGPMGFASLGGASVDQTYGCFETASGEALNLTQSAAVAVGGHVAYILV